MSGTVRQELRQVLAREGSVTARDLSRLVGVSEREVTEHLRHLERTLRRAGAELVIEPSRCLGCDFVFARRERTTRPGRCPRCGGRRLTLPRFGIRDAAAARRRPPGASGG